MVVAPKEVASGAALVNPHPLAYRVRPAGEQLGLSERQVWRLIQMGELPVVRAGRATLIPTTALQAWLERKASQCA